MNRYTSLIKNFSISTLANLIVLLISVFSALVFPKILSVEDYSYWQLYVFYIGFITIAGLGWMEGVYLRNGGKEFNSLNRSVYAFQTYGMAIFASIVFAVIAITSWNTLEDRKLANIVLLVCIEGVAYNLQTFPIYLLQATNRIKEYSIALALGRGVFLLASVVLILCGQASLYLLILGDILGGVCCSIFAYTKCRTRLLGIPCGPVRGVSEVRRNMSVGISLMAANMVGIGITGVIKYAVQTHWSVVEFGKIALSITCTNLFLKFMTAVGTVLFPMLCNFSLEKLKNVYASVNVMMEYAIATFMIFYYPAKLVLAMYLPQYAVSLEYMGYLLPICLFETKVALLLNTYYKAMRKERVLMVVNLADLILSVGLAVVATLVLSNITLAVFSILIVLAVRALVLEVVLCKRYLGLKNKLVGVFSILIAVVFILANGLVGGWLGMLIYAAFVALSALIGFRNVKSCVKLLLEK